MKEREITDFLSEKSNILICDRYVSSSMLYDTRYTMDRHLKKEIQRMMELEYSDFETPVEDRTIILKLSKEFVLAELSKREATDVLESDISGIKRTIENVDRVAEIAGYDVITCDSNGIRLSIEDTHELVWASVMRVINASKGE